MGKTSFRPYRQFRSLLIRYAEKMTQVFVDTIYWIAITRPGDQWQAAALKAREELTPEPRLITTDEVLTEFLERLSARRETMRKQADEIVHAILNNSDVQVFAQSRQSFP